MAMKNYQAICAVNRTTCKSFYLLNKLYVKIYCPWERCFIIILWRSLLDCKRIKPINSSFPCFTTLIKLYLHSLYIRFNSIDILKYQITRYCSMSILIALWTNSSICEFNKRMVCETKTLVLDIFQDRGNGNDWSENWHPNAPDINSLNLFC